MRSASMKNEQNLVSDLAPAFWYVNGTNLKATKPMHVSHMKLGQHQCRQRAHGEKEFHEVTKFLMSAIAALRSKPSSGLRRAMHIIC